MQRSRRLPAPVSEPTPRPSMAVPDVLADDRAMLADLIIEDALQLVYVAAQDLDELETGDDELRILCREHLALAAATLLRVAHQLHEPARLDA